VKKSARYSTTKQKNRHHLLSDLSNAIADEKVSILSGQINSFKDVTARMLLTIEVNSQNQLDRVIGRLKAVRDVIEVERS
jgi:GTP pyrophosphokinase